MITPVKRVAAIHDLSGFGRASLTMIIPILSNMGIQVCPMPTAILSTHTSGFPGYSFVDLTDTMVEYKNHWKQMELSFECIYTGFLGSPKQIDIVSEFIDDFSTKDNLVLVDPVMGDNGKLYETMNSEMVENMRRLIGKADIITPNFTEAAYLLDRNYDLTICEEDIKKWLVELSDMGPNIVIMTSVPEAKDSKNTSVIAYDRKSNKFWKANCKYIPIHFPGTGDGFASVVVGSLLQGDSLPVALDRGVQFISSCIRASYGFDYPTREGVLLEKVLPSLNMPVMVSSYELI